MQLLAKLKNYCNPAVASPAFRERSFASHCPDDLFLSDQSRPIAYLFYLGDSLAAGSL